MKTIDELKAIWNSISPASNGYILIETEHPLEFHIGYSAVDQKCFIVNGTGMITDLKSSKAITVQCGQFAGPLYSLRFTLVQNKLEDLFIKLCWNLIEASQGPSAGAVERLMQEYVNWQRLFQHLNTHGLSAQQQKGLIGELLFLSETIDLIGASAAMVSWVGPEGSDQDFLFETDWAEVKTTTISSDKVLISSLQQLDRSENGRLIVYRMDKTTAHGVHCIDLPGAIKLVNDKLENQHLKDIFECKLLKHGLQSGSTFRQSDRFYVAKRIVYSISEGFPRLTPASVPSEVVDAKYSISLSAIATRLIEEVQW